MYVVPKYRISIHAPRVGCDTSAVGDLDDTADFNPRTPGGVRQTVYHASTHLLHFNPRTPGGVRPGQNAAEIRQRDFNPRTPGGVRHIRFDYDVNKVVFQSTHPGWGATLYGQAQ